MVLVPIPAALGKPYDLIPLSIALLIDLFAVYLNRLRHTKVAGIIAIFTTEAGLLGTLLSIPGGIAPVDLPLFDLLAESVIIAAYMIGPGWGFVIMGLNIVITWGLFHSPMISPGLSHLYANNANTFTQVVELQISVAVFSFILCYSSNHAIKHLDRAEEIVALERREIERQEEQLKLKQQLEDGIEKILQTHVRAANGDFKARAPLTQDNVLWKVAYSLNNLLARLQHYGQLLAERKRTEEAVSILAACVRAARANKQPIQPLQRTGTVIDELIVELAAPTTRYPHPSEATRSRPFPRTP